MEIRKPTSTNPDQRQLFRFASTRPQVDVQTALESDNRDHVGPARAGQNQADYRPVHTGELGHLSKAPVTDGRAEVEREAPRELGNWVIARDIGPRETKLCWGKTAWARTHALSLLKLIGTFDEPSGLDEALLVGGIFSQLGTEVHEKMKRYTPKLDPQRWQRIAAFVHDAVSVAAPMTPYTAERLLVVCTAYVDWCANTAGLPLDARIIFRREAVEYFITNAPSRLSPGTLRNYRSMILRISEVLLPEHAPTPMRPLNERSSIPPYSPVEIDLFRRWARGQNTAEKQRKAMLMLALCTGAGLKSLEVAELRRRDFQFDDQGVLITVGGADARQVPVLSEWEPWLREAAEHVNPEDVVFGMPSRSNYRNLLSGFVATTVGNQHPRSDRLRATWLTTHLRAGTPMKALMKAAGIAKFENLSRYLQYIPELDTAEYRAALRLEVTR